MVACWLCGDELHKIADPRLDEFVWVDAAGSRTGADKDLRHLSPSPYGHLAWLRDQLGRGDRERRRGAAHTWLYWAYVKAYVALKVRLDTGGTFHEHVARAGDQPAWDGAPVPECCGWPMWRRPSGWHCRQGCGEVREAAA